MRTFLAFLIIRRPASFSIQFLPESLAPPILSSLLFVSQHLRVFPRQAKDTYHNDIGQTNLCHRRCR